MLELRLCHQDNPEASILQAAAVKGWSLPVFKNEEEEKEANTTKKVFVD